MKAIELKKRPWLGDIVSLPEGNVRVCAGNTREGWFNFCTEQEWQDFELGLPGSSEAVAKSEDDPYRRRLFVVKPTE